MESLFDEIFEKLFPCDSDFTEILEQAEKEKNERNVRENASREMLEPAENEKKELNQMKENESLARSQVDARFESNSGDKKSVDKDEEHGVPLKEKKIANKLRDCCDSKGRELPKNLKLSTKYLLKLGNLYLNYAVKEDWIQRLSDDVSELELILDELMQCTANDEPNKVKSIKEKFYKVLIEYFEIDQVVVARQKDNQRLWEDMVGILKKLLEELEKCEATNNKLCKTIREYKIQQNLNFVKAAALMVGSIVRWKHMKEPELIQIAQAQLCILHREIMKIDTVKGNRNVDILTFTEEIKRTLESYRKKIAVGLESVDQILEETNGDAVYGNAEIRVSKVREICKQCTEYYLEIMAKVAEKCVSIMGKPPCNYSIIGLGSLARKEVTLYSDFEHAIILEEGVGDESKATEYFRWFSTIFQVIIIGLGETVIPRVGVKSLNDFYSSGERKAWFRDEYTPDGVSFDGMMPHACKSPLGRQERTKRCSHTVELIQPVTKMVNFLSKGEEVKNGYFLCDILSKVCFVFGSQEVYDDYLQKSRDVRNRTQKEIAKQQRKIIEHNPNSDVRYSGLENLISDGKIKNSIYRPLTTLLSCAAAFHSLPAKSSFEIADELRSREIIDNQMHRKLMSAVSTSMEMRLRVYLQAGYQKNIVPITELEVHLGKERLMNCYSTLHTWRKRVFEYIYGSLEILPSFSLTS